MGSANASELPDDFKCPISLELMSDPVILPSGHTFDRASIQRWLDAGHRTCPITKMTLPDPPSLIPNHALRSLISNFTLNPLPVFHPDPSPRDPQTLVQKILSSSSEDRVATLDQMGRACKTDLSARRRLAESGVVSAVLTCVESIEVKVQEKALHLLLNLSLDDDSKVGLVAEGVVGCVVHALRWGRGDSRALAATVLTSLAVVEVNKATIGSYPDAIPGLVGLLQDGCIRERKESATALFTLCSFADNRVRAVRSGVVGVLVDNLNYGLERAVEVLGVLGKCSDARDEMLAIEGLVGILLRIVKEGSSRGVTYALNTLSCLCCCSDRIVVEALSEGVLELCVELVDDENDKVRRNARNLILVLQGRRLFGGSL